MLNKKTTLLSMKLRILLLFITIAQFTYAQQIIGLGMQYSEKSHGQFVANVAFPTLIQEHLICASAIEYTTPGKANMSGLHIKPIQLLIPFMNRDRSAAMSLGVDGGYLIDFRKGHDKTFTVTPHAYIDLGGVLFLKTGYDFDLKYGQSQFFIRAGFGFGLGIIKRMD